MNNPICILPHHISHLSRILKYDDPLRLSNLKLSQVANT